MDPVTIAAGFAVARQSIRMCRSALESANDVSQIGKQLDNLFHSLEKKEDTKKKKKKTFSKLREAFAKETHTDVEDDTSLGAVAADVLEKKKLERQIYNLGVRIDNKFGDGTWKNILEEREERIKNKEEKLKKKKEQEKLDRIYKEEEVSISKKLFTELGKVFILLGITGFIIYLFILYKQ